eukprot:CAMPEP_0114646282 /NCGR_PEP_ID=MMETSP0191-20121206/5076_1 /TAXON_ID=126664 /ORGANISM="Sorites sp." /LENGTH=63 /DNA_ID=CAMNT_0001859117 /DNA_START=47 /DNA_END=238 /DNA_ORIENTATION=-
MGCKGSKAQVQAPTKDSKGESAAEVETTVPENDVDVSPVPVGELAPQPKIEDSSAASCTFCCA